jgi:glutaminase
MYDFSGEFAFTIGLPAKSGVSGAIMVIVPNTAGFCIYSPKLDKLGNSVRGLAFCKELVSTYNFHTFDSLTVGLNKKKDPRQRRNEATISYIVRLCWAASEGDLSEIQNIVAQGIDLNSADYDGRTALHLAASEGHLHIIEYLIAQQVNLSPKDRWGGTPLSDATKGNHTALAQLLRQHGAE